MPDIDIPKQLLNFQRLGRVLLDLSCNNSHSGNLSIREEDKVLTTRTGAMLGHLSNRDDLVLTSISPTDDERHRASSELIVHLGIYANTQAKAVAHGHALWAVLAAWLVEDTLKPIDVEGSIYFADGVPVVECVPATASPELAAALGAALARVPVAVVRGHGVFAIGDSLEQAVQRIASVNDSARLLVEARKLGLDVNKLRDSEYLGVRRL